MARFACVTAFCVRGSNRCVSRFAFRGHLGLEVATRPEPEAPELHWFDSRRDPSLECKANAQTAMQRLFPGQDLQVPPSCCPKHWCQTDGWSCGSQVTRWIEHRIRIHAQQPARPIMLLAGVKLRFNVFLTKVQATRAKALVATTETAPTASLQETVDFLVPATLPEIMDKLPTPAAPPKLNPRGPGHLGASDRAGHRLHEVPHQGGQEKQWHEGLQQVHGLLVPLPLGGLCMP